MTDPIKLLLPELAEKFDIGYWKWKEITEETAYKILKLFFNGWDANALITGRRDRVDITKRYSMKADKLFRRPNFLWDRGKQQEIYDAVSQELDNEFLHKIFLLTIGWCYKWTFGVPNKNNLVKNKAAADCLIWLTKSVWDKKGTEIIKDFQDSAENGRNFINLINNEKFQEYAGKNGKEPNFRNDIYSMLKKHWSRLWKFFQFSKCAENILKMEHKDFITKLRSYNEGNICKFLEKHDV